MPKFLELLAAYKPAHFTFTQRGCIRRGLICEIGLIYEEEVMNNWSYLRVVLFVSDYCSSRAVGASLLSCLKCMPYQ